MILCCSKINLKKMHYEVIASGWLNPEQKEAIQSANIKLITTESSCEVNQ